MIKPPLFGKTVAADSRRMEFNVKNEQVLFCGNSPDMVFIRDSITHHWELKAYFDGFTVNRGIGGDSILPTDIAPPFNKEARNNMILSLNAHIKEICGEKGLKYIDYHSKMCQPDGRTLIYELSYDGIHPNAKGYEIMANILKKELEL